MQKPPDLSNEEYWVSDELGKAIAKGEYGLIVGGWAGVDHVVARAFAKEVIGPLSLNLLQVLPEGKSPDFDRGRIQYVASEGKAWSAKLVASTAIILVGGRGGVFEAYERAIEEKVPVFPVLGTHGDAERIFQLMPLEWKALPEGHLLGQSMSSREDAAKLCHELLQLIGRF